MKHIFVVLVGLPTIVAANERPPLATDRPGFSDGSNVVGRGISQIETGFFRTMAQGTTTSSYGDLLYRFGLTDDSELRLIGLSYGVSPDAEGLIDPSVGFKYRLQRPSGRCAEITFIGQSTVPVGAGALRANAWNPTAKLAWTVPCCKDTLGGNIVYSKIGPSGARFDQSAATLYLSHSFNARFALTAEAAAVNRIGVGQSGSAIASIAGTYLANNDLQYDLRIGTGFNQSRDGWFLQGGISLRF